MTHNRGDVVLKDALKRAIEANETPVSDTSVCPSHEGIRLGVHTILLCEMDDRFPEAGSDAEADKTREVNIGRGLISFKNMTPKGIASIMWQCIIFLILVYIVLNQMGFKLEVKELLRAETQGAAAAHVPDRIPEL